MPEVTAKMTEKLRLAMSSDHFVTEDEMPALRRKAVEGVKRIINRRATNNAIMAEWIAAREEAKKGRMR